VDVDSRPRLREGMLCAGMTAGTAWKDWTTPLDPRLRGDDGR
jgi:hypothetical protein